MGYILMLSGTVLLIKQSESLQADMLTVMIGFTIIFYGIYLELIVPDLERQKHSKKKSPATDQSKQDNSKRLHRDSTTKKEEIQ